MTEKMGIALTSLNDLVLQQQKFQKIDIEGVVGQSICDIPMKCTSHLQDA